MAGIVVVVGSINRDVVAETTRFPRPGETVLGTAVRSSDGGKGANQAVAAARVGARVALIARIGDDDAGRAALAALKADSVNTELISTSATRPTGTAVITVAEDDNTIVVVPGANHDWPKGWPSGDGPGVETIRDADVVLAQLEIPIDVVAAAATATRGRFVLNAAPAMTVPNELLARCDVLIVNEHELAITASTADPMSAPELLRARGVGAVVTTLGARGAIVTDGSGTYDVPASPAEVIDSTGAGDAFAGVLCAQLAAGRSLAESVRWAAAAGSLAVRAAGARGSYPDAATLAALVDSEGA